MDKNTKWIIIGAIFLVIVVRTVHCIVYEFDMLCEIDKYTRGVSGYIPEENVEIVRGLENQINTMKTIVLKDLLALTIGIFVIYTTPTLSVNNQGSGTP